MEETILYSIDRSVRDNPESGNRAVNSTIKGLIRSVVLGELAMTLVKVAKPIRLRD